MTSSNIKNNILELLAQKAPLKAREIAEALGADTATVNQALYGPLKSQVQKNSSFQWLLASGSPSGPPPTSSSTGPMPVSRNGDGGAPMCPKCGAEMVQRTARNGDNRGHNFWGCSAFPACRGTRDVEGRESSHGHKSETKVEPTLDFDSVTWRESRARSAWASEYLPVGAISPLFSYALGHSQNGTRLISQTLLLLSRHREGGWVEDGVSGLLAVVEKILSRGKAPFPSLRVEAMALQECGFIEDVENLEPEGMELGWVWRTRHDFSDARLLQRNEFAACEDAQFTFSGGSSALDSEFEERFLDLVADADSTLPNWILPQVPIQNLVPMADRDAIDERRIDFLFCHPRLSNPIAIEIDGPEHLADVDRSRDNLLISAGIDVIRIPNTEIEAGYGPCLESALQKLSSVNVHIPPQASPAWRTGSFVLECSWGAKLQFALLRAIQNGWLSAAADAWEVQLDSPLKTSLCAIHDFLDVLDAVETLYGGYLLPGVVYVTQPGGHRIEFRRTASGWDQQSVDGSLVGSPDKVSIRLEPDSGPFAAYPEDRVDVLVRPAFLPREIAPSHASGSRVFLEFTKDPAVSKRSITRLLQIIFRKQELREGQAEAIFNALRGVDSIVLLPTGGGKSIIYQLSGLLSPGITLVIDPLVALIEDQIRGLRSYGIDRAVGISSANGSAEERRALLQAAERGEFFFILVAPERMQSPAFRDTLRAMAQVSRINLAVIDEAHCVSEWGHDFRPAYLNLPRNIRRLGKSDGRSPTILGLTGTASRAVLRDMVADLALDTGATSAIVRPQSFDRKELSFRIIQSDDRNAKVDLRGVLMSLPTDFRRSETDFYTPAGHKTFSGVVFTPFVRPKDGGVIDLRDTIRSCTKASVTVYSGSAPVKSIGRDDWNREKRENARRFMENEVPVLVATKAFGMGIDKPNIRYTIHYGMPGSLEAFYQEAGRAGRDRKRAQCVVLYSRPEPDLEQRFDLLRMSLAELRTAFDGSRRNGRGDLGAALFFHLNAFQGADQEIGDVREMLERVTGLMPGQTKDLPFASSDDEQKREEKALFRLVQVGVLSDYEVDYGRRITRIIGGSIDPDTLADRVIDYVRRSNSARVSDIQSRLQRFREDESSDKSAVGIISVLIEFCYDTIERARRRSIFEALEAAKQGRDPDNFRRRVLDYLQEGMDPESFQRLVESETIDFSVCVEILEKINNSIEAGELRGIAIRFLESYPDHPVLLVLRAVSESLSEDCDSEVVMDSLINLFGSSPEKYSVSSESLEEAIKLLATVAEARTTRLFAPLLLAMDNVKLETRDAMARWDNLAARAQRSDADEVDDVLLVRRFRTSVARLHAEARKVSLDQQVN